MMPPLIIRPYVSNPLIPLLRAGFATSKPAFRTLPPGPRGSPRRPPPPLPKWKRSVRRRQDSRGPPEKAPEPPQERQSSLDAVSGALRNADQENNSLLSPVHIPEDPDGVLNEKHPATSILSNSSIVVTRQLELMNVMLGFEQANKYVIMDPQGQHIGYMAERELGMGNMMARQIFSTHRSFTTHVFDRQGKEVLRFHRPFSWISSRIGVYDPVEVGQHAYSSSTAMAISTPGSLSTEISPEAAQVSPLALSEMRIIGEAQQQWAPLRRKYNLFLYRQSPNPEPRPESQQIPPPSQPLSNSQALDLTTTYDKEGQFGQFAYVDEPFLSWDFSLLSADNRLIGSVNRNFAGFGREIFTDTGVYALRMDAAGLAQEPRHLISKTGQKAENANAEPHPGMTLDQRAVMLATAVSVDFDYFSRKSGSGGGGFMPLWFPGMGGGAEAGAGAEVGAEAGAVEEAGGVGGDMTRGGAAGMGESGAVGAGSVAGYEAVQRGRGGNDASPTQPQPGQVGEGEDVWGNNDDPWNDKNQGDGDGGDGGGDGWGFGDFFDS
ncbi:hypothetical protein N7G274_006625 [Stereocaulon virgatum]|uniref:Scramblase-domain-containing protein n=1 Tax=Stereocaulon virgatum TaxID=373712 RepID=A0ABR4A5M5_9LECA